MNCQQILREINDEIEPYRLEGRAADYIPGLARVAGCPDLDYNPTGNSVLGMHALELLTSKSGLSIF